MDDEEMIRDFVKELLESLGYDVELASDGEEAVRLYQTAMDKGAAFCCSFHGYYSTGWHGRQGGH